MVVGLRAGDAVFVLQLEALALEDPIVEIFALQIRQKLVRENLHREQAAREHRNEQDAVDQRAHRVDPLGDEDDDQTPDGNLVDVQTQTQLEVDFGVGHRDDVEHFAAHQRHRLLQIVHVARVLRVLAQLVEPAEQLRDAVGVLAEDHQIDQVPVDHLEMPAQILPAGRQGARREH